MIEKEEAEKCKDSLIYFYNNYLRKEDEEKVPEDYFKTLEEIKNHLNTTSPRKWSKSYYYG